jgi:hypothetical protein
MLAQKGHRKVTERSQKGHRKVTERSQKGHRKVTERSQRGRWRLCYVFQFKGVWKICGMYLLRSNFVVVILCVCRSGRDVASEEDPTTNRLRAAASKLMGSDEADKPFGGEVQLESHVYWWHDKHRPRRPKYFNRVHTGGGTVKYCNYALLSSAEVLPWKQMMLYKVLHASTCFHAEYCFEVLSLRLVSLKCCP